jgi:D-glycero-D-manno-heptose 1,7-bisphosphate phosphatase
MAEHPREALLDPIRLGTASPRPHGPAAVFLDRDGVLNDVRGGGDISLPPRTIDEIIIARDARDATLRLRHAGFLLIVVTNQPDVARGTIDSDVAIEITRDVMNTLALDDGYVCIHDEGEGCECKKPRPGMLLRAAQDWGLALDHCWMIGDRWVDIAAAEGAGVRPVLLETQYSWQPSGGAGPPATLAPEFRGTTLTSCASFVLAHA